MTRSAGNAARDLFLLNARPAGRLSSRTTNSVRSAGLASPVEIGGRINLNYRGWPSSGVMTTGSDMEQALTALYGEDQVAAVITLKVDTKEADRIATEIAKYTSVPRNIRRGAAEAKARLAKKNEALDLRVTSAIMIMDDLANDPNIPLHGRTLIWNVISQLETVK